MDCQFLGRDKACFPGCRAAPRTGSVVAWCSTAALLEFFIGPKHVFQVQGHVPVAKASHLYIHCHCCHPTAFKGLPCVSVRDFTSTDLLPKCPLQTG